MSDVPELRTCIQVMRENDDGSVTSLRWDLLAGDFDRITSELASRYGPAFFGQMLTAAELAVIDRNRVNDPMGHRWWPAGVPDGIAEAGL